MLRLSLRTRGSGLRFASTFVDPFAAKDPNRGAVGATDLRERNRLVGYSKIIGDPEKGLADDTSVHPFGDLRINLARFNTNNLCFWWEYDFTGGKILNNGQNALLSNETKNKIYALNTSNPRERSVEWLAEEYGIRQQRVMAIISLKRLAENQMRISGKTRKEYKGLQPPKIQFDPADSPEEEAQEGEGETPKRKRSKKAISDEDWCKLCDWAEDRLFGATAERGSGERHFVSVPTFPKFKEIPLSEAQKYVSTEWSISRVNRMYTAKEDKFQIREFKERLLLNTREVGTSLDFKTDRTLMHRSPPKTLTPIVVTSLGQEMQRPYVAEPDGTQRKLTEDEFLIWKRTNREAFTKLVEQQIQREGKRTQETTKH